MYYFVIFIGFAYVSIGNFNRILLLTLLSNRDIINNNENSYLNQHEIPIQEMALMD